MYNFYTDRLDDISESAEESLVASVALADYYSAPEISEMPAFHDGHIIPEAMGIYNDWCAV